MKLEEFDYLLPEELIAQQPLPERDASNLLVLHRPEGKVEHRRFGDLGNYLGRGDLLVLNNAKVIPARLEGKKVESGGRVELVLTMPLADPEGNVWRCIGQASKAIRPGMKLDFQGLGAQVLASLGGGTYEVRFFSENLVSELDRVGSIPLPPYIRRMPDQADRDRYQTVFASRPGAAAAPTAGFHFTKPLLDQLSNRGVEIITVTLYVGAGTFLPIRVPEIAQHRMHAERYEVSPEVVEAVARTRSRNGKVVAVGTTSARTLESSWKDGALQAGEGISELFIYPGYRFRVVDALITNFHLPKSTLLLLVSAFASQDQIRIAYQEAVNRRYRFFSYGDAMLIL